MIDVKIPPEALEAAARAVCETENGPCECLPDECGCTYWKAHACASIAAAINAWPEMGIEVARDESEAIILPLPLEAGDE